MFKSEILQRLKILYGGLRDLNKLLLFTMEEKIEK